MRLPAVVLIVATTAVGALALTKPRETVTFVSVKTPVTRSKQKGTASVVTATIRRSTGNPSSDKIRAGAPSRRNLFLPLVKKSSGLSDIGEAILPLPVFGEGGRSERGNWEYVGLVNLNNTPYALIQEKASQSGVYLKQGDVFRGGHILAISKEQVVVMLDDKRYDLPMASGLPKAEEKAETPAAGSPQAGQTPAMASSTPTATALPEPLSAPTPPAFWSGGAFQRGNFDPARIQEWRARRDSRFREGRDRQRWDRGGENSTRGGN